MNILYIPVLIQCLKSKHESTYRNNVSNIAHMFLIKVIYIRTNNNVSVYSHNWHVLI